MHSRLHKLTHRQTLNAFIKEAGLAPDVGASTSDQVTIEQILQEKKTFDLSLNFEKLGVDTERRWLTPGQISATVVQLKRATDGPLQPLPSPRYWSPSHAPIFSVSPSFS